MRLVAIPAALAEMREEIENIVVSMPAETAVEYMKLPDAALAELVAVENALTAAESAIFAADVLLESAWDRVFQDHGGLTREQRQPLLDPLTQRRERLEAATAALAVVRSLTKGDTT